MATLLQILDKVGLLVGGTAPNPAGQPHFYSGSQVGDGTGLAGINGCYAIPPEVMSAEPPVAILEVDGFTGGGLREPGLLMQGNEEAEDRIRIWVLCWRNDLPSGYVGAVPFRDTIPQLFRDHIQLGGLIDIDTFVTQGRFGTLTWAGTQYVGWEFQLRIRQLLSVVYRDS